MSRALCLAILALATSAAADRQLTPLTPMPLGSLSSSQSEGVLGMASDGAGGVVALFVGYDLKAVDDNVAAIQGTGSLYTLRSLDGGATWATPEVLVGPTTASGLQLGLGQIASDGTAFVAIWIQGPNVVGGGTGEIVFARSTDVGATWTAPASLSVTVNEVTPSLAADTDGTMVAVWSSPNTTDRDLRFARSTDGGTTWSPPATLNTNAATDTGNDVVPSIATDGAGTWVVVWVSDDDLGGTVGTDRDVLVSRSVDDGATWSAPAPIDAAAIGDTDDDSRPFLALDASGAWVTVWMVVVPGVRLENYPLRVVRSTDDGVTWSSPVPLTKRFDLKGIVGAPADTLVIYGWWPDPTALISGNGGLSWETVPIAYPKVEPNDGLDHHRFAPADAGTWVAAGTFALQRQLFLPSSLRKGSMSATRVALCGDDVIGAGETCEDGNTTSGDGCSATCRIEGCYTCSGLPSVCTLAPRPVCKQPTAPHRSVLDVRDSATDTKDSVSWQWSLGEETRLDDVGDAWGTHDSTLCIYEGTTRVFEADAPAAGSCVAPGNPAKPCWQVKGMPLGAVGLTYKDKLRTPEGLETVDWRFGAAGKAKLSVKGKGVTLPDGVMPLVPPLTVQLHVGNGACWGATFSPSGVVVNDGEKLKAISD